jgi:hypothetical protein
VGHEYSDSWVAYSQVFPRVNSYRLTGYPDSWHALASTCAHLCSELFEPAELQFWWNDVIFCGPDLTSNSTGCTKFQSPTDCHNYFRKVVSAPSAGLTVRTVGVLNPPCFLLPPSHFLPSPSTSCSLHITILWIQHTFINISLPIHFEYCPANAMAYNLLLIPMHFSAL